MKTNFTFLRISYLFSLFLLFLGLSQTSYAQEKRQVDNVEELFNIAALEHQGEFRNLRGTRGATLPTRRLDEISAEGIARTLAVVGTDREGISMLFYSHNKDTLQTWLINEQGIQAYHRQNISEKQLDQAINQLRSSLGVESLQLSRLPRQPGTVVFVPNINTRITIEKSIANLSDILLPETIVSEFNHVRHLIIVPTLGIGSVPSAVLQPFGEDSFLIDEMSISVAPSLFDIGQYSETWNEKYAFSEPLIVGNPLLPESDEWVVPALPGAEREAQAVAKIMNSNPLILAEATKEKVLSRLENSTLLYFATHGVANTQNPMEKGFLMFSAQTLEQGWWTAREIQQYRTFNAQIAVLSACQTGLGRVHDAGIIGVARAFQIAGVPRVVMSLWNVNDKATNELMQAFVKHLKNHIPSEALRLAMLETREIYPDPSDWASFVLFGSPR